MGPAAACAWPSAGKFSTRQKRGPLGSAFTFFSATGLTLNSCADTGSESSAASAPTINLFIASPCLGKNRGLTSAMADAGA
jgi:hypothetical protein